MLQIEVGSSILALSFREVIFNIRFLKTTDKKPFNLSKSDVETMIILGWLLGVHEGFGIQATGTVEFEDGLWIGNHLKAGNSLQWVHTIPGV